MIPGWTELLIIAGLIVLLFGPQRLPELGAAVGKAFHDFRHSPKH